MASRRNFLSIWTSALAAGVTGFFPAQAAWSAETRSVAPGPEYEAGALHRFFFGDHWRDSWSQKITVPVLDLKTFAGGLTPIRRGGDMQTKGLRFKSGNGKEYKFRSVNKDPTKALSPELRDSVLADVVQDQISAGYPLAPLLVAPFATALGVYQTEPILVMLPDDPALGEFRSEFANMIGTFEENATIYEDGDATFEGTDKLKSTFKLFKRLEADPDERVDARAYLTARLLDIFVGDWDRHQKQWKWARIDTGEERIWRPIAKDRDQAFSVFDGIFPWLATRHIRQINGTTETYPRMEAQTWSGRYVDRRILTELSREEWLEVTKEAVAKITDDVIEKAIHNLPPELIALDGERLRKLMRARRARLTEASMGFYEVLAETVDVRASEGDDFLVVDRPDPKHLSIQIYEIKASTGIPRKHPYYARIFEANDTNEVRVHLLGGQDRVENRGVDDGSIRLRILRDELEGGEPPQTDPERFEPPRDYGRDWWFQPVFKASSDEGVLVGGGPIYSRHDYRKYPHVYQFIWTAGYAIGANRAYTELKGDFPVTFKPFRLGFDAKVSQFEVQHFYGFGNESARDPVLESQGAYLQRQTNYELSPTLSWTQGPLRASVGTGLSLLDLSASTIPYSSAQPVFFNANAGIRLDFQKGAGSEASGPRLEVGAAHYPAVLGNSQAFSKLKFLATSAFPLPGLRFSNFSVRAGGERVTSAYPYFQAAFIGGDSTLRGYTKDRFAGDASLYGGGELRVFLTRFKFLFPGKLGVLGYSDVGRVFLAGESSSLLHAGVGCGFWASFISPENTAVLTYSQSPERNVISLGVGFAL